MYTKKMQRVIKDLNPLYFDPTSDDQVKMREHVRHKKIAKTIVNLKKINTQNADVQDFLPSWATKDYFDSLHGKRVSEEAKTKVDIEEIKIYVGEIVEKARESVLHEAASLKALQVPQDSEPLKKEEIDKYMNAIHQQLLASFNPEKKELMMDKCETVTEQTMAIHAELKKVVFSFEDDEDDCFIPRKLFLFEIEGFQKVTQQNMETPLGDVDPPNTTTSEESVADHSVDCVTPSKEKKRSLGRRFLRCLGFR